MLGLFRISSWWWSGILGMGLGTHIENREHHIIVVDEKYQLLLAMGKFSRHPQDEILHLTLQS